MKCYAFYVVVLLVHHISGLQVGAHLRIPLTRSLVCRKRRLKGTVGVTRGKWQKIQQLISIYPFIKMFSLLNKNQLRIWIRTRHQQLLNNKHKLQCGGQHASTKTHKICTHCVDQKNSLSCYIYITNSFPKGITK